MTRYHPAIVVLHWIMAVMIIVSLLGGKFSLKPMPLDSPDKVPTIAIHMSIGLAIGALFLLRLGIRLASDRPPHATTGNDVLDWIGTAAHWVLYGLVAAMVLSGIAMAFSTGLFSIAYGGSGEPLPANLSEIAPRLAHGLFSTLLLMLVGLHIAAALYHQFFLRDGLFRRMWFGKRR
ncbi:cytochrome b [Roseisalinus antarcticus]|uniref:Cytochrome b561 n=1 Tax=Roseisalinus antarcticus TaxID=254357 RepID=A0A1Y5SBY8_9RHOB|nr:cytochrome b/b6 domain-containing protein [Roseisalinus antarcticus]SLN37270.1 cytochrome b561 [Roseisalinus antarcticus]